MTGMISTFDGAAATGPQFLRRVLLADAVTSAACGLAMLAGAGWLAGQLGLPPALLVAAGASLLPFAAFVAWVASRAEPRRAAVWLIVGLNVVWAADSLLLLMGGAVAVTALGKAFVIAQAMVVAVFAAVEASALRTQR